MALTNVELYEALKEPVGLEAARMIAEIFPPARELATRQDLLGLEVKIAELELRLVERIALTESRIAVAESRIMGRLWVMFVPLWVGMYGLIATLIVRG